MRVLYFTQYFPPEVGATQTRADEMTRYLAEQGHSVTVITEVPNHPSGIIPKAYRGRLSERRNEHGVDVLRLWVWASPEKTFTSRLRFYLSYMVMATLAGTLVRGKYDVVIATSPPLFVGAAGLVAALVRRIPFVFEVRDLWPESAIELGELRSKRAIRLAEKLEALLYRRATRIIGVTNGICSRLLGRGVRQSKVVLIPNGANIDLFSYDQASAHSLASTFGLEGKFVALYAGIHGIAQGLETILEAAHILRGRDDIVFIFIGEGPRKSELLERKETMGLANLLFLPEVPTHEMPGYLSLAGCAIVPLRDEPLFRGALPSKMFEAWSCGRPVVLSVAGEAVELLNQANAGIAVAPENPRETAAAILYLAEHRPEATRMGESGARFVRSHFSRREQARKLEALLKTIVRE